MDFMDELQALEREKGVPADAILDALANALVSAYLEHRTRDPFDLLGVAESAGPADQCFTFIIHSAISGDVPAKSAIASE